MSDKNISKKIFIGIPIPASIYILNTLKNLKMSDTGLNMKWVNPENLHLTLKFIGQSDNETINTLHRILKEIAIGQKKITLKVSKLAYFEKKEIPKILYLSPSYSSQLYLLQQSISHQISRRDKENEKYTPHITIARIKRNKEEQLIKYLTDVSKMSIFESIEVSQFCMYESISSTTGVKYIPIYNYPLK